MSARFISKKEGLNRLILIAKEDINTGEIEIVSTGEMVRYYLYMLI